MNPIDRVKKLASKVLSYIVDPELQQIVKTKTFITGGCFKSLYHKEFVNDYDFYFKDRKSCDRFLEIVTDSLNGKSNKAFSDRDNMRIIATNKTQFAITFMLEDETKIQFITKFVGSPEEVTGNFDFAHTQNWYDLETGKYEFDHVIINRKELIFNPRASHPVNALKRLMKFVKQGWTIEDSELIKISEAINALDLDDYNNFREQIAGMYHRESASYKNIVQYGQMVALTKDKVLKRHISPGYRVNKVETEKVVTPLIKWKY